MDFSPAQNTALAFLTDDTRSCLISGVAGSGKSTIVRAYQAWRVEQDLPEVPTVAPTGIAALNVGGSTIHRLFGLRPQTDTSAMRVRLEQRVSDRLRGLDALIVDEVSMVRADLFSYMDKALRFAKGNDEPFGGVRMIFVGDYWQLPPVVQRIEQDMMLDRFGSKAGWNFLCPAFTALAPKVFFLAQSFRQGRDAQFAALLNGVRDNESGACKLVNRAARKGHEAPATAPVLCSTNRAADDRNRQGLAAVDGEERTLEAVVSGDEAKIPQEARAPITLRQGCRVMITRNKSIQQVEGDDYVNGSVGTLTDFDSSCTVREGQEMVVKAALEVQLDGGGTAYVPMVTDEVIEYVAAKDEDDRPIVEKKEVASVTRYPVKLGYAWTIHKSQGQTLEAAVIDLGRGAFAHGMTYVALSRVTTAEGLFLAGPVKPRDLKLDPAVPRFFEAHAI
jgi:ATP-dependent exoDNAse (exonuclease V) alpha subunit